jgi:hypothetical protein
MPASEKAPGSQFPRMKTAIWNEHMSYTSLSSATNNQPSSLRDKVEKDSLSAVECIPVSAHGMHLGEVFSVSSVHLPENYFE